jgi:hypothetical protein
MLLGLPVLLGLVAVIGASAMSGCGRPDPEVLVEEHRTEYHSLSIVQGGPARPDRSGRGLSPGWLIWGRA